MTRITRRAGTIYYVFTALSTIAASYYLNYLFFFLHDRFGFGNRGNLATTMVHGALYAVGAWQAGRFAQRRGLRTSLLVGFTGLTLATAAGAFVTSLGAEFVVLIVYSLTLPFLWPALEALITHTETPSRVPHAIGVFNCTWSGFAALAYFTGGGLYQWSGRGAVFVLPAVLFAAQLVAVWMLPSELPHAAAIATAPAASSRQRHPHARMFLQLARIANPFAYVAIYTLLAVMPELALRHALSPSFVGVFCSVWMFGRLAAFAGLWNWSGWHYRLGWLFAGYALLTVGVLAILAGPTLAIIAVAQVAFGLGSGLIYYSSLFYAMDVGEDHAEHSGVHEAAIGAGISAGPGLGTVALTLFPHDPRANVIAVGILLVAGFAILATITVRSLRSASASQERSTK